MQNSDNEGFVRLHLSVSFKAFAPEKKNLAQQKISLKDWTELVPRAILLHS